MGAEAISPARNTALSVVRAVAFDWLSQRGIRSLAVKKQKPNANERKVMNNKFDELAKGMAQSVTRRGAL
jgi:hypothetical protein